MRLNLLFAAFAFFLLLSTDDSFAQVPASPVENSTPANKPTVKTRSYWERDSIKNTDPSLNGQYKFLLSRTRSSLDGNKLVAPNRLTQLWKNVTDTLKKERLAHKTLNQKIIEQQKTITYLKTEISSNENSISSYSDKLNEIRFLGMSFDKANYNFIVWGIIVLLSIALIILVVTSGSKINEAKHRIQLYDEISEEYQNFKSKTVEKERKFARELQDERNKLDDLLNKK